MLFPNFNIKELNYFLKKSKGLKLFLPGLQDLLILVLHHQIDFAFWISYNQFWTFHFEKHFYWFLKDIWSLLRLRPQNISHTIFLMARCCVTNCIVITKDWCCFIVWCDGLRHGKGMTFHDQGSQCYIFWTYEWELG